MSREVRQNQRLFEAFVAWHGTGDMELVRRRFPDVAGHVEELQRTRDRIASLTAPEVEAGELPAIPGYRILRRIGRGGMGTVFEAVQESVGRPVALKILGGRGSVMPTRERFRREARALGLLRHPGLVSVFEAGQAGGVDYLAMELVSGIPLDEALRITRRGGRQQALPGGAGERALVLAPRFAVLAEAIGHAHARGVVHRDIKPANIILGNDGALRIVDFGIARIEGDATTTVQGMPLGTPATMSPEQVRGMDVGPASDIFSLGATLYEALALAPAFPAVGSSLTVAWILERVPRPLRSIHRELPRDLETVVSKAMALDPADRYRCGEDFASDLWAIVEGRPVAAQREPAMRRVIRGLRRHPKTAAASVAFLCLAVFTGITWWRSRVSESRLLTLEAADLGRRLTGALAGCAWEDECGGDGGMDDVLAEIRAALGRIPADPGLGRLEIVALGLLRRNREALEALARSRLAGTADGLLLKRALSGSGGAVPGPDGYGARDGTESAEALLMAAVEARHSEPSQSIRWLDQAIGVESGGTALRGLLHFHRALLYVRVGDDFAADEDLTAASMLQNGQGPALAGRIAVLARLRGGDAAAVYRARLEAWIGGHPGRRLAAARTAFAVGAREVALDVLMEDGMPEEPGDKLRWIRARLHFSAGPMPDHGSLRWVESIESEHGADPGAAHLLAHWWSAAGDNGKALRILENLFQRNPGDPRLAICFSILCWKSGDLAGAEDALGHAEGLGAPRDALQAIEAGILLDRGEWEAARLRFEELLARRPSAAVFHAEVGKLQSRSGAIEASVRHHRSAFALEPRNPWIAAGLADALAEAGEAVAALEVVERFPAGDPSEATARLRIVKAKALLGLHRIEEAADVAASAIPRVVSHDGDVRFWAAEILLGAGRVESAVACLRDALLLQRCATSAAIRGARVMLQFDAAEGHARVCEAATRWAKAPPASLVLRATLERLLRTVGEDEVADDLECEPRDRRDSR